MGVVVAEPAFKLGGVEPKSLQRLADSGRTSTRWVCPDCGSWIAGPARDGVIRVRGGTLDDTSWLRPTRHIWARSKQPWIVFGDGDEPPPRGGRFGSPLVLSRVHWVSPQMVVEVSYVEMTPDGKLLGTSHPPIIFFIISKL
jgi:hypothetical protein